MPDGPPVRPTRHRRADVVDTALGILARQGLPDLTMRALGAELGVQQSAIYHHFPSKQALLGAVADEILARGPRRPARADAPWPDRVRLRCEDLHGALLRYPDGADLVMSMWAFGLGAHAAHAELVELLTPAGLPDDQVPVAARTLLHYVYGHAHVEQSRAQARRLGALPAEAEQPQGPTDFAAGLDLVVAGISRIADRAAAGGVSRPRA